MEKNQNKILVIQGRLDAGTIRREQINIKKIADNAQVDVTFANPLSTNDQTLWEKPAKLLQRFKGTLWLGSGDIDIPKSTQVGEHYLNKVMPLAQKIINEDEYAQGICLGHQVLSLAAGGEIVRIAEREETGTVKLNLTEKGQEDPLFSNLSQSSYKMIYGHKNSVHKIPSGFTRIGHTERDPNSALRQGNIVTFQGHPEITDTNELKFRIALSKKSSRDEYVQTHPLEEPDPTHKLIINFLRSVKAKSAL